MVKENKMKRNKAMYEVWGRLKKSKMAMGGLIILVFTIIIAIIAPLIIPYDYAIQDYDHILEFPNRNHWFGTDNFGRDIFSRVLYGSRYTLIIGFGCMTVAAIVGTILGVAASFNTKMENIIMRSVDVIMGIPNLMLAVSIIAALGSNIKNMMIALCITATPAFVRIVRAQVLTVKEQEFIEAARSIGASNTRIILRHILPNSLAPIIVQYTLGTASLILWGASLSFIGMGVQAPKPEWGLMISAGRVYLHSHWHMAIIPGMAIMIITYALNLLGDGLRDALDPRLKQ